MSQTLKNLLNALNNLYERINQYQIEKLAFGTSFYMNSTFWPTAFLEPPIQFRFSQPSLTL